MVSEQKNAIEKPAKDWFNARVKELMAGHNIDLVDNIDCVKGNMSLGINLLMYLTEIASKSLNNNFLSKVFEVHHKHKKDHPSGTALMLGKGIAIGKNKNFYKLMG